MARVRINNAAMRTAAVTSSGYHSYARSKAKELEKVAKEVFNAEQVKNNQGRTSETTPPKYLESFEIDNEKSVYFLRNTDRSAMWVEFGAHAGGETYVLEYRPLTRALEIVASRAAED